MAGGWGSSNAYEITGSRTESYNVLGMSAKVSIVCPWNTRYEVMQGISQTKYPLPNGASNFYLAAYPKSFEVSVFEEKGSSSDVYSVSYTKAKIDVSYECRSKYNERSITETLTPILNMRRLPAWGFYWRSDGSPILDDQAPAILNVQAKITRQCTGCQKIPVWFYDYAGCVNDAPWLDKFTNNTYDTGTLLFIPSSLSKAITTNPTDEDNVWDIGYELMWNPVGWNNFMRPHGIDYMMFDGRRFYFYVEKSFSSLIAT
jgi:hypothetical protein